MEQKRCTCAFAQGSTSEDGRKEAPMMCRQAILDKFKTKIEKCDIDRAEACPLGRFYPLKEEKAA